MIRAGRGGVYAADWLERGIIGIGWDFGGADITGMNREKIRAAYAAAHPSESKQKVAANVGQIYRFAHCMAQGSTVVMYDPAERLYHIGDISGPCKPHKRVRKPHLHPHCQMGKDCTARRALSRI